MADDLDREARDDAALSKQLRQLSASASEACKAMAQAHSLNDSEGTRDDIYSWPEPDQTPEGKAAARITALSAEVERLREASRLEYQVGDKVVKPRGYPFPGTVVSAFVVGGGQRFVVESDLAPGMLHIFSGSQLKRADAALEGDGRS